MLTLIPKLMQRLKGCKEKSWIYPLIINFTVTTNMFKTLISANFHDHDNTGDDAVAFSIGAGASASAVIDDDDDDDVT